MKNIIPTSYLFAKLCFIAGLLVSTTILSAQTNVVLLEQKAGVIGDQICFEINLQNFDKKGIGTYQISWDNTICKLGALSAKNNNFFLSDSKITNANNISFSITETMMLELQMGMIQAEICLDAIAEGKGIVKIDKLNSTSNSFIQNGSITISNTFLAGEKIIAEKIFTPSGVEACVEITVEGFTDVNRLEFGLTPPTPIGTFTRTTNFNPSLAGLSETNITDEFFGKRFIWSAPDPAAGVTLMDGSVILEFCYDVTGSSGQSVEIGFTGPFTFDKTDGSTVSTMTEFGSITIENLAPLEIVDDFVSPDNCLATDNGEVQITPQGGAPPYTFMWSNMTIGKDLANVAGGSYTVTVSDSGTPVNQITMTYEVPFDTITPIASVGPIADLTCTDLTITLGDNNTSMGSDFEYQWLALADGNIVSGQTDINAVVDMAGEYSFRVTDASNGCTTETLFTVSEDKDSPNVNAGEDQSLPCTDDDFILTAMNDQGITTLTANWESMDGTIDNAVDQLSVVVSTPGTYNVTVTNSSNGCTNTDDVTISASIAPSVMLDGIIDNLNCDQSTVPINITTDSDNIINWTTTSGSIDSGVDMSSVIVSSTGTYIGEVTDPNTNCSAVIEVEVMGNTSEPTVDAGEDAVFNCSESTATVTGTTDTPTSTIVWSDNGGNFVGDELSLTVNQAGLYTLSITNEFGCERSDEVMVTADTISPLANAGADFEVGCIGNDINLDGTASSQGAEFTYMWSTSDGILASGFNTLTPLVSSAGTYDLIVTNSDNGCTSLSNVVVGIEGNLSPADGGPDFSSCESTASLSGNTSSGITGMWTSTSSANIDNPSQADIAITNLQAGENAFIWSLSTADCQDYSRDTVKITFESTPTAVEDIQSIPLDSTSTGFYVLNNDNIANNDGVTVDFQSMDPNFMDLGDGVFSYTFPNDSLFTFSFSYVVCSEMCPSLCDSTTVTINREEPMIEPVDLDALPNAITPNGDGLNDALVFDIMLLNPQDYPNPELVVFNRWGDIVYKQRPYDNNWQGTNQSGGELPEGTYYFINRLSIENNELLRGDITIIRD